MTLLKCTFCLRDKPYTEFNRAGWGRPAPDGSKRHQNCKVCKKYKHRLSNPVRVHVDGKMISPNSKKHPHHEAYQAGGYEAVFEAMGLQIPDFDPDDKATETLASNSGNEWLDHLMVPEENRELRVGPYQVDALYHDIILEFYGSFYHADPRFYQAGDKIFNRTAEEVWLKDQQREQYLAERYPLMIVWEHDWRNFANKLRNSVPAKVVISSNVTVKVQKSGHFISQWLTS